MVTPDYLSAYSDASSSYWPPGWNFARFANSTVEEYASLSDEERNKMHAGFRDALGQDGFAELSEMMFQEELRIMREKERRQKQLASGSTAPIPLTEAPQWLRTSREKYRDQPWGFLAFYLSPPPPPPAAVGTASSDSDASTQQQQHHRQKFQDTVWEMTEVPFNTALNEDHLDANEARSNFEIRWVEVVASADDEEATILDRLRYRYREMVEQQEISWRFAQTLFLVANVSSVSSVLAVPESTRPGKYGRPNAPFLLAVETVDGQIDPTDEEAERLRYAPVFKVAIEALVEELWHSVEGQTLSMETLTRWVRKARLVEDSNEDRQTDDDLDDIWWTAHAPSRHIRKKRGLE